MPTVSKVLEKGIYQVSEADLKMLDDRAARSLTTNKALSASYTELATTIRAGIAAEAGFQAERAKGILLNIEAAETSKKQMLADVEFRELGIKAVQREMAAKAAATTKELGFVASLKEAWMQYLLIRKQGAMINVPMPGQFIEGPGGEKIQKRQDVKVDPIGRTAGLMGVLGAGASAAATGIGAAISKLTGWGTAALMAYEGGSLLISAFTKTEKESAATAVAIEKLTEAGKTVNETLKDIASRNTFERLTIDSINARTTAFGELTLSISNMISSTNKEMDKMEGFDKFINFFKGIVGQDVQSKSSREFAKSIETAFKAAVPSEATTGARKKIEGILGVSVGDIDGLKQAYMSLGGSAGTQIKQVVDSLSTLAKEQQLSAARGIELRDSWKESGKALTAFMTSSLPQDPLSKLGQDMMADAAKMQLALNDPIESLVVMKALAGDINALKLFPPEAARNMAKYSDELNMLSIKASNAKENLGGIDQEIASLSSKKAEIDVSIGSIKLGGIGADRLPLLEAEAEKLRIDIQSALDSKKASIDVAASIKVKQDEIKDVFGNAVRDQFIAGANILASKIATEWAKASTIVSGTLTGLLGDSLVAIDIKAKNDKLNIEAQRAAVKTQMYLIIATEKLSTQVELDRLSREKGNLDAIDRKSKEEGGTGKVAEIVKREAKLEDRLKGFENKTPEQLAVKGGSADLLKQFKAGKEGVTREDINFQQMLEASKAQLNTLGAQYKAVDITKEAGVIKIIYDQQSKARETGKLAAQDELDKVLALEAQGKILRDIDLKTKNIIQNKITQAGADQQIDAINAQIALKQLVMSKLDQEKDDTNKNRIRQEILILETIDKTKINQEAQNKILNNNAVLQKSLKDRAEERLKFEIETSRIIQATKYTGVSTELEVAGIRLETEKAMDLLTADEYNNRKAILDLSTLELSTDKSRTATQEKYADILKDLEIKKKTLFSETEDFAQNERRIKAVENQRDVELAAIGTVAAARRADIIERSKYTDRQNAYADVFKKSFEGMADAIVEFARTGKLSFKDLINTMIADLVRWELREQASSLYKLVRPGLMDFIGSMFSGGSISGSDVPMVPGNIGNIPMMPNALGAAYDMGIKKFAMGGTFANSIVSSPTLFKFASGTGLMGEAGPEAIMPLKRDAQGNLGVRSGNNGGNVEVVVNNYGSEKATTKESTDSRGNRKVEVIIGDLSAGDISKSGSNSQRSLRGTYGLQPALIRR
jgi:lambda family phage tail tape measure protein